MIKLSFFDGFNVALPYQQIIVLANPSAALTMTGTATPSDVRKGKTFYNTDASTQLTGVYTTPTVYPPPPKTKIKHVENPINEPLALTTTVLLAQKVRDARLRRIKLLNDLR